MGAFVTNTEFTANKNTEKSFKKQFLGMGEVGVGVGNWQQLGNKPGI